MNITAGVVTYNNESTIEECLRTLLEYSKGYDFRLYVYDNGSEDKTVDIVSGFPEVTLIKGETNKGFGFGHNSILKRVHSDYHFVINPDIHVDMDAMKVLAEYLEDHEDAGLVTPRILNTDGTEQYLPKYCPTIRYVFISKLPGFRYIRRRYTRADEELSEPTDIEFCTGCFFGARTKYMKRMKGFSNRFFMYCEDTDLSQRVRQDGKKIVFCPDALVYHNWNRENTGNIRGIFRFLHSLFIYSRKWGLRW